MQKRIISAFLAAVMLFSACFVVSAETEGKNLDPVILVHGMMGWGENACDGHKSSYWGTSPENNIITKFRAEGYEVYAPSVGAMSSAWDRACELYAQLAGTVVDYGKAHSEKYGHARYGRDYTGRGFLSSDWYKTGRINLVSHSFGGPTVMVFASLLAHGSQDEIAASPGDCSPLFEGGHGDAVFSVTTLESPFNGSTLSNLLNDTFIPVLAMAMLMNISGTNAEPTIDFMLDQWGITADPSTGKTASFNPIMIWKLATSRDHCAYDMSLQGARKLCETCKPAENTYYFSVACNLMEENSLGMVVPGKDVTVMAPSATLISLLAGLTYRGIKTDKSWAYNDGMVPLASARFPYSQAHAEYDGTATDNLQTGVWYMLPVVQNANHGFGSGTDGDFETFWGPYFTRMNAIKEKSDAPLV